MCAPDNALLPRRWLGGLLAGLVGVAPAMVAGSEPAAGPPGREQSFHIQTWAVDDGTPDNTVLGTVRRRDGYLWVVTRAGLFRFDGEKYQAVRQVSAAVLPGVATPVLCEDRRGRMWLTKDTGVVACVDGADIRVFTMEDGLPAPKPVSMAEDGDGAVWLSYDADLLCRIKDGQVQTVAAAAGMPGKEIVWLAGGPEGQVWFARGHQVGVLRAGRLVPLVTQPRPVTRIAAARQGGVWLSDGKQVWKYREGGTLESAGRIPAGVVRLLSEDRCGRLWVATIADPASAGLFCHEGGGFRPVPVVCPFIVSLGDDREGNLWVGTRPAGVIQVRPRTVELVDLLATGPCSVQSICEDRSGACFAVYSNVNLARSRGAGWESLIAQPGWPAEGGVSLAADPRGGVWIGTLHEGLFQWRDGRCSRSVHPAALANQPVRSLMAGSNRDLWIGMQDGGEFYRLRDGRLQSIAVPPGGGAISSFAEDAGGFVWAATTDGLLLRVGGDASVDLTPGAFDAPEPIRCLHATPDGSLWIGYESRGLGRLRQGDFFLFGPEQGMEDDAVSQILSDEHGWLWCAGDRGIFRVKLAELEAMAAGKLARLHPVLCGRGEGWPVLRASANGWPRAMRSTSGELWMPTSVGLAVIRPERSPDDSRPPAVVIERLSVNGRSIAAYENRATPIRGTTAPLVDLRGLTGLPSLGQGVRQLVVEYRVVSFNGLENVRYRYRLDGLDDTWVEAGPQRVAYYSQVPPGDYRFRVSACSNEGIWNETGAALAFMVAPFFWQTWWFRLLVWFGAGILVGGVVWLAARRRLRRQREQFERRQATDRERARIAADLHDDLGARLTEIGLLGSLGIRPATPPERAKDYLGEVAVKSREMVAALDEIVWAANPRNDDIASVTNYLCHYAQRFLEPTSIRCRLDVATDLPRAQIDSEQRHELLLAFKEALNNVVRHSAASEMRLRVFTRDGMQRVVIEDNGHGFPGEPDVPDSGGLFNMRERLARLGGRCEVRSAAGQGTSVDFALPLAGRAAFGRNSAKPLI